MRFAYFEFHQITVTHTVYVKCHLNQGYRFKLFYVYRCFSRMKLKTFYLIIVINILFH